MAIGPAPQSSGGLGFGAVCAPIPSGNGSANTGGSNCVSDTCPSGPMPGGPTSCSLGSGMGGDGVTAYSFGIGANVHAGDRSSQMWIDGALPGTKGTCTPMTVPGLPTPFTEPL